MIIPDGINQEAWAEFEQHRKDIKHPLTDLARKKAWALLQNYSYQQQQETIDASIISGWRGLFPNKAARDWQTERPQTKFQRMSNALQHH